MFSYCHFGLNLVFAVVAFAFALVLCSKPGFVYIPNSSFLFL